MSRRVEHIRRMLGIARFIAAARAVAFWLAVATGEIFLAGLHAALNPESPAAILWRQS